MYIWLSIYFSSADAKRLIGRRFDDAVVQSDMKHWPFEVINDNTRPKVQVEYKGETKSFYPEEVSSMVLVKMKEIAEAYLGKVWEGFFDGHVVRSLRELLRQMLRYFIC